jgi:hypothetical protein
MNFKECAGYVLIAVAIASAQDGVTAFVARSGTLPCTDALVQVSARGATERIPQGQAPSLLLIGRNGP